MKLKFHTLDVFTQTPFAGNPLAVVLDADDLPAEAMAKIAREFNLSETVFILRPENQSHSARLRIFTPVGEVAFAGHPIIGAASLLAGLKSTDADRERDALVTLELGAGVARVGVRSRPGEATFAEFDAPKLPTPDGTLAPLDKIAAALRLIPSEIGFANHRPTRFSAGNSFAFVPVASLGAITRAEVDHRHWASAFGDQDLMGAYLYTCETVHTSSAYHARLFAPDVGILEDPATGSAAVALAGVIHRFDAPRDGLHKRIIEQGYEMKRESEIILSLVVNGASLETVRIGGMAVEISKGTLTVA